MRNLTLIAAVAMASLPTAGCAYMDSDEEQRAEDDAGAIAGARVGGSGDGGTRSYAATGFTGIVAAGSDNVEIVRGERFAVTATGSDAVLDRLIIRVRNGDLEVRRRNGTWSDDGSATIRVTMPTLTDVTVAGSGDISADRLDGDAVEVTIAGSGNASFAEVAVRKLDLTVAGTGKVEARGTAEEIDATIAGTGDIAAPALTAARADISIAGSGNVAMRVTQTASVSTVGSGNVELTGGARCTHERVGGGQVRCS